MSSDYIHIYTFIYIYIDGVFSRVYMYIYIYIYIFVLVYTCESEYFCILYSILLYLYMFMLCFWHNSISISAKMLHWRSGGTHGYVAPEQLGNCGATLVKFASKGHPWFPSFGCVQNWRNAVSILFISYTRTHSFTASQFFASDRGQICHYMIIQDLGILLFLSGGSSPLSKRLSRFVVWSFTDIKPSAASTRLMRTITHVLSHWLHV